MDIIPRYPTDHKIPWIDIAPKVNGLRKGRFSLNGYRNDTIRMLLIHFIGIQTDKAIINIMYYVLNLYTCSYMGGLCPNIKVFFFVFLMYSHRIKTVRGCWVVNWQCGVIIIAKPDNAGMRSTGGSKQMPQ